MSVTGSHIKRAQISGVGPITVIDAEAIERSGAISVETLLQRLPVSAGFAGSQTNAYWVAGGWGTTQVNLRGLGINRTLVLVNGRRVVNGGNGANNSVDLNMIPVAMIERMEVLKDGASAIYGADAVAGVVNIITKKQFDGLQAALKYGQTSRGDGQETALDLTWGISSERGSLMAALSYVESGDVRVSDRQPCPLREVSGALQCVGDPSTIGGRARLADGRVVNFNQQPGGNGNFFETYSSAKHDYNFNTVLNAVNPNQRLSLSSFGQLALTEDINFFTELMYTNRQSDQLASPGSLGIFRPVLIAANHPTNPTGQSLTLLRRRLEEAGVRDFSQDNNTLRTVVGLEGQFGTGWNWNIAANLGRNTSIESATNIMNLDRVDQTLNTSICSNLPGAAIPCADYLGFGDVSRKVLDYIMFTMRNSGGNEQRSVTANLSGELFELPAGWVGFATGVEVRKERGWLDPDALTVIGSANTNLQSPIDGGYSAREVFVEFAVPLLSEVPFADALVLNAAARYSDYDLFGTDTNYKLGLDWQVVPSLKVRANFSTAFRIPSIPELFGGVSQGSLITTDPCSRWSSLPASSVVYQNCQASRVPVGYVQAGGVILTTRGGNINLQPEQAETFTLGTVWSPGFVPGLTLTLDYYRIKIDDAIRGIDGSTKLSVCYNTPGLSHLFCSPSNFTREPVGGEINFLSTQPVNAASEQVSGVDLGVLYEFAVAGYDASLNLDVSYLNNYDVQPFPGAQEIQFAGKVGGGRGGFANWRSFGGLKLARNRWSGSYSAQWIGSADDINARPGAIGDHAPSVVYHNAQVRYAWSKAVNFSFGINNVFDKKPPFIQSWTDANTDTMTYDLLGRRWNVKATYRW